MGRIKAIITSELKKQDKLKARDSSTPPTDNANIQVALQFRQARRSLTQRILEAINARQAAAEHISLAGVTEVLDVDNQEATDDGNNFVETEEHLAPSNRNSTGSSSSSSSSNSVGIAEATNQIDGSHDDSTNGTSATCNEHMSDGSVAIESADDTDLILVQKVDAFNAWVRNNSISNSHSNAGYSKSTYVSLVEAAVIPGFRIGTIATADIQAEQVYLSVPPHAVLDVSSSRRSNLHATLEAIVTKFGGRRDDFHHLLFTLLWETFVEGGGGTQEGERDGDDTTQRLPSQWWPYLALLPTPQEMEAPAFWSEEELEELKGTFVYDDVLAWKTHVHAKYTSVKKHVFDKFDAFMGDHAGSFSEDKYTWAHAILDSRGIWWNGQRHLVPLLDLVNCAPGLTPDRVHATVADNDDNAVTKADRAFEKGMQVFEDYGQSNNIYLTYHGFTLGHANHHHCVQVQGTHLPPPPTSDTTAPGHQDKQPTVCVYMSATSTGESVTTTSVSDNDANSQVWEQLARLGYRDRVAQLQALRVAAETQLKAYPTTLEADKASIDAHDSGEAILSHRVRTAILFRLHEKKLLMALTLQRVNEAVAAN
jgi:hypothetical protein